MARRRQAKSLLTKTPRLEGLAMVNNWKRCNFVPIVILPGSGYYPHLLYRTQQNAWIVNLRTFFAIDWQSEATTGFVSCSCSPRSVPSGTDKVRDQSHSLQQHTKIKQKRSRSNCEIYQASWFNLATSRQKAVCTQNILLTVCRKSRYAYSTDWQHKVETFPLASAKARQRCV